MNSILIVVQVLTGLLTVILTGFLVYFYKGMRDAQMRQSTIIEEQASIQEKQTEIQQLQTTLSRGQNRPLLHLQVEDALDDSFLVYIENRGRGTIKRMDVAFYVYILRSELEGDSDVDLNFFWNDEDEVLEVISENTCIEIADLDCGVFETGSNLSLIRPERGVGDYISLKPDGQEMGYVEPRLVVLGDGYNEKTISEVVELLSKCGIEQAIFQWQVRYQDLAGVKYFEHLESRRVNTSNVDNLEDILEEMPVGTIPRKETTTLNYYEKPSPSI